MFLTAFCLLFLLKLETFEFWENLIALVSLKKSTENRPQRFHRNVHFHANEIHFQAKSRKHLGRVLLGSTVSTESGLG